VIKAEEEKKKKKKKRCVRLSRHGWRPPPIHRCYPTTVERGSFCLLCFHPGPVHFSLTNLVSRDSSQFTILTPDLAWTPDRHRTTTTRNPHLKPFYISSLQVAGLQARATTPGWWNTCDILVFILEMPRFRYLIGPITCFLVCTLFFMLIYALFDMQISNTLDILLYYFL